MDDPNTPIPDELLCLIMARCLTVLRDQLIELSQTLEDELAEMDCEQTKTAGDIARQTLESLKLRR